MSRPDLESTQPPVPRVLGVVGGSFRESKKAAFTRRFVNAIPIADSCNIADSENVTYVRSSRVSFLRQSSLCFRLVQFV
jgi:hypothetical protein